MMINDIAELINVIKDLSISGGLDSDTLLKIMVIYAVRDILIAGSVITLGSVFIFKKFLKKQ